MSILWKSLTGHKALSESKESSMQQQLQEASYTKGELGSLYGCGETAVCRETSQSQVSSMREAMLSKLFLLHEARAERSILDRYVEAFHNKPIVYIAGPYSSNPETNVKNAMRVAELVLTKGGIPYIPHLTHFWEMFSPKDFEFWLAYDLTIIASFDKVVLVRIPGESTGANIEELFFNQVGYRTYTLEEIKDEQFRFF